MKNGCISHMDLSHFDPVKKPEGIGRGAVVKDVRTYGHFDVYGWVLLILCFASVPSFSQGSSNLQEEVDLHSRLAQQYLREARPDLAITEFQAIVALDPKNEVARGNLGVLLFFRGDFIHAAPELRAALKLRPDLWNIQALLGVCERRIGEKSQGLEDLESAFPHLQEDKIKLEAGNELIVIYSSTGDLDKAEAMKHELAKIGQRVIAEAGQNQRNASEGDENESRRVGYEGDSACLSCHKRQSDSYLHTSHHLTSQVASEHSILGSFNDGSNLLMIQGPTLGSAGPGLYFKMEKKDGNKYETAVMGSASHAQTQRKRIDIVIGSGVRGQSYLYWDGDALYELPVSYWSDGRQWINSPGYFDGTADFSRPVHPRCLECHVTYIKPLSRDTRINRYDKGSLVTGISCESCHGPGADHISKMRSSSAASPRPIGLAIENPAKFSRDRQVDLCALCHNGIRAEEIAPAFSYLPGKVLDKYVMPDPEDRPEHPEVHGNQVGLLQKSRCYLASPNMTCSTCHDVHAPERAAASYSTKCMTCHKWDSCGMAEKMGHKLVSDCIDCHMPVEPTKVIVSVTAGKIVRATMRSHWIKVYPDTQKP